MITPQTLGTEYSRRFFFIAPQHVGRRRQIDLHMFVKREPVHVAQVARFADPQDYGTHKAVEAAEHVRRRHFSKIPWADCVLNRLEQSILADALRSAEQAKLCQGAWREPKNLCGLIWGQCDR